MPPALCGKTREGTLSVVSYNLWGKAQAKFVTFPILHPREKSFIVGAVEKNPKDSFQLSAAMQRFRKFFSALLVNQLLRLKKLSNLTAVQRPQLLM